ncbi:MAG: hypothetical protein GXX92_05975, partial [Clostridiales bacterium]|nr:hypothetical protein [Clostridiales bacterium]
QRHATSKIRSTADLDRIRTLGFRGEALTSIAAVSKVEIITKTAAEKAGIRMVLEGGKTLEESPVGCSDGTTIIVTDLFYNTPARLKFMKTDGAEGSLIIDFVSKMALAYPDIRFRMISNGTVLFSTRGKGGVHSNILTIYSKQIGDRLIEIDETDGDYRVQAFISPPDTTRPNRRGQVYFVNGRSVSNRILETAVSAAYQERIAQGRCPLIYLFLTVPPDQVDVNIHPNKREVRFDDNDRVSRFVTNALNQGLQTRAGLPSLQIKDPFREKTKVESAQEKPVVIDVSDAQVDIKSILSTIRDEQKVSDREVSDNRVFTIEDEEADYRSTVYDTPADDHRNTLRLDELQPLGSIFATYILAVDEEHFYLIDQHAAHERVFYEKLLSQFQQEEKNTQLLLTPTILETTPAIANSTDLWIDQLLKMGFSIEPFGVKAFRIKGIPSFMELNQAMSFLDGFMGDIETAGPVMDEKKLGKIITSACKSAVKANDALTMEEIRRLLKDLSEAKNPLSCPHGRPTILMLSAQDIERLFKRA